MDTIHTQIRDLAEKKHKSINQKLTRLSNQKNHEVEQTHNFHPRVKNLTNIKFNDREQNLLQKGLKYNIQHKPAKWIQNLALEAENNISKLPQAQQAPIRYLIANNIESLYTKQNNHSDKTIRTKINDLKTVNQIKKKLRSNQAIITKADKGDTLVIINQTDYDDKVQNFITKNNFHLLDKNPTNKFQTEIRKTINKCKSTIPNNQKWKYTNLNPEPPTLKGLPKIHKTNTPIRPIINWKNAPAYRLAQFTTDLIKRTVPLPFTFNVNNSVQLMEDLQEITITANTRLASFDITDMYTNIPTTEIPRITNDICNRISIPQETTQELTLLISTILKQNYFKFNNKIYNQTQGLAMGAPTSAILSEIYLQHMEHNNIWSILLKHNITGYFRYVDDILLIYNNDITEINQVLNDFNTINPAIQFTIEKETNNNINFLDITINRHNDKLNFDIYRKPTCTDLIIPRDSNHPIEHKLSAIRFLHNRNSTYPTNPDSKQREHKIINQILHNNLYNPQTFSNKFTNTTKNKKNTDNFNNKRPWAKFTYAGPEIRRIAKIFKNCNINVAYTTGNNLHKLLTNTKHSQPTSDPYNNNGVYQLTCTTCNKRYIGQTGRSFHTRFKEHVRDFKYNTFKSNFAKHLIEEQHPFPPINDCMKVIHQINKGSMLNTLEKFYIYKETKINNQLNDANTAIQNTIFDTVLRHQNQ
jgi:hypothetical protein